LFADITSDSSEIYGAYGNLLQALDKILGDKEKLAPKEVWSQKEELLRSLGWNHWADLHHNEMTLAFPDDYAIL
jgi:hypothetical protein